MRVLAIRGRNLTSIDGGFELDFASGPLAEAGIFAITGPTGAGKSTILDALCVALYNKTPRLHGIGGVEVGREGAMRGIPANDPRNLLRDGAGEGWAEVDFVGKDGKAWRARWSVRRAHRKPDGPLQNVDLRLEEIGGGRVGGTLRETLAEIEARIGLDFDQFRRAVLLAQGDFAAFLRAKSADRASLLEQMTGTTIYGEISTRAYDRAAREAEVLREIEAQLADTRPATPEERVAMVEAESGAGAGRTAAAAHRDGIRAALAWHAVAEKLAADVRAATDERARAEATQAALRTDAELLAAVDAAEPARGAVEGLDAAAGRAAGAVRSEAERAEAARIAAEATARAAEAVAGEDAALATAEAARDAAAPEITAARSLDARVRDAVARAAGAEREALGAERAAAEARAHQAACAADHEQAKARLAEQDKWLTDHAATEEVHKRWGELRVHLATLADATPARARAVAEAPRLATALTAAQATEATALSERITRRDALAAAQATATTARAAADATADPDRPLRRTQLSVRRDALTRCGELVAGARRLAAEIAEARADVATAEAAARAAEQLAAVAGTRAEERAAALTEAREGLRRVQAAQDLTAHRAALVHGEHCPLCGATEHPWADGAPLAGLLADQAGRVTTLEAELSALRSDAAGQQARLEAARAEGERARGRLALREEQRAALGRAWVDARIAPLPDALPDALPDQGAATTSNAIDAAGADAPAAPPSPYDALADAVTDALAATRAELDALDAATRDAERAKNVEVAALAALADAERRAADVDRAVATATRAREAAERAAADNTRAAEDAALRIDAALLAAAPAFPASDRWRTRASADPRAFLAACEREVDAWVATQARRTDLLAAIAGLQTALAVATTAATERATLATTSRRVAEAAAAEVRQLRDARAALLGGADADVHERALLAAVTARRAARDRAHAAATAAAEHAAAARAAAQAATEERGRRDAEHAAARVALDDALAALGLPEALLRDHLSRDRRWRDATRTRLRDADRAVADARTREAERTRAADAHTATDAPAEPPDALRAALPLAEAAHAAADEAWSVARSALLRDDDRRERAAALLPQVDAQRVVTDRWRTLGRLIGSRDGSSFRRFAQSLTLNLLLAEANDQLRTLDPRYQLQRVPNDEMELQVADLHMAEQIRPLTSLSGGETFLVSLALALGLASLASTRARVESLFIDEGFGTLDTDTLDTAIAALEGLRAEGRTVGIISHVGGLAERLGTWVSVEKIGPGRSRVSIERG